MDKKYNLNEFDPISLDQWKEKILKDLKGKSIEGLNFEIESGLQIGPFHHRENGSSDQASQSNSGFELSQKFEGLEINDKILSSLNAGVNSIVLGSNNQTLESDLKDVFLDYISLHLDFQPTKENLTWLVSNSKDANSQKGSFRYAPLSDHLFLGLDSNLESSKESLKAAISEFPKFRFFCVDICPIHNLGGDATDELSIALSQAHEYLVYLLDLGYSISSCSNLIHFKFATSSSFFKEVAKFRAIRLMWSKILMDYGLSSDETNRIFIRAESGFWNKTTMDSITNTLRLTTETLSGILGNVNSFVTHTYDALLDYQSEESFRISRNIQHILLEESYVKKVEDISKGSYYIENLTQLLCEKSWNKFAELEKSGGVSKLDSNSYLNSLKFKAKEKIEEYVSGNKVLLGVNKYQNKKDKRFTKCNSPEWRIAQKWEEEI